MTGFLLSYWGGLFENLEIALILFFFIWLLSWAKGTLGSAKLAVLFAFLVTYLTVYSYRELVWLTVLLFLFTTFGKDLFEKVQIFKG
ncbi:MAG TPA: hypothetical protein HA252_02100 [Candidatus Diapherotrites archaeon]|uniref:Uncharacterized protein n=1 Tax=Candidatus Iainarchaeum sp. TaxID=3101447 RepID=A0A7J4JEJ2_9ARCH|nr:hypothetical protein [Candidatus Diapherotrites archaeon]HIH16173.1 hypothetical protein [Candidatus Diapherotrites archaeon]